MSWCIVKTNLKTQAQAHVLLFSSDLALPFDKLIDYYCLRFQLEFNFRDAKQYWGLEDFMTTTPTAVTNAANLSLFMVNLVERLLQDVRQRQPAMQRAGSESALSRRQIRRRNDKTAPGKAGAGFIGTHFHARLLGLVVFMRHPLTLSRLGDRCAIR